MILSHTRESGIEVEIDDNGELKFTVSIGGYRQLDITKSAIAGLSHSDLLDISIALRSEAEEARHDGNSDRLHDEWNERKAGS